MTQVKQAVQDFETKYEKRIRNLKVTSNLPNVEDYLASFRKNMVNTGYNLFNPFDAPADVLQRAGVSLGKSYPHPLVDVKASRLRALDHFAALPKTAS